jgi:hypothetical protein
VAPAVALHGGCWHRFFLVVWPAQTRRTPASTFYLAKDLPSILNSPATEKKKPQPRHNIPRNQPVTKLLRAHRSTFHEGSRLPSPAEGKTWHVECFEKGTIVWKRLSDHPEQT